MEDPIVLTRDLRRAYAQGPVRTEVLRGVDLAIPAGGLSVIFGPSGSGKSTLLNLLGGLDRPSGGEIMVAGVRRVGLSAAGLQAYRRDTVSVVFQFYNLLPTLTAVENVAAGLEAQGARPAAAREVAMTWLQRVGLEALASRFPGQLSGGEQQRVALVRALARGPRLRLAVEPTASVDRATSDRLIPWMAELSREQDTTFLVVTHDPHFQAVARQVVSLENGRVARVEAGGAPGW